MVLQVVSMTIACNVRKLRSKIKYTSYCMMMTCQWLASMVQRLIHSGFTRCEHVSCVYCKKVTEQDQIYLLLYVDDMLVACKHGSKVDKAKRLLKNEFEIKDIGHASKILGMEIIRDRSSETLFLSHRVNVEKILRRFNMDKSKHVQIPICSTL